MSHLEDHEILSIIKNITESERGFRLLIGKYKERLYYHIRRMVLSHDDADDILQNTFIKVFRGIEGFEGNSQLFTWLYRIATNETLTFIEQKKRKKTETIDNPDLGLVGSLKADPFFEGGQAEIKLAKALLELPERQKLVFQMRYYDELSYKEISEILGTSEGALKASYHHAVAKVEQFFKVND